MMELAARAAAVSAASSEPITGNLMIIFFLILIKLEFRQYQTWICGGDGVRRSWEVDVFRSAPPLCGFLCGVAHQGVQLILIGVTPLQVRGAPVQRVLCKIQFLS
jgi:hypothetical protein